MLPHLGLGWNEAHHPYPKAGYVYTPAELMEQFMKTVLPLAVTNTVPNEPPLELTKAVYCIALDTSEAKDDEDFRIE